MGPITKMFCLLVFFSLFWLCYYLGHYFLPAYLGCALFAYMVVYTLFYKDPPDNTDKEKK